MAREVTYQSQVNPAQPAGLPQAGAGAFGAAIGGALGDVGGALARADQLDRQNRADSEASTAALKMAEAQLKVSQQRDAARANPLPGAAGHAEVMAGDFDAAMQGIADGVTDRRVQRSVAEQIAARRAAFVGGENMWATAKAVEMNVENLRQTGEQWSAFALTSADPNAASIAHRAIDDMVDGQQNIGEFREPVRRELHQRVASGDIQRKQDQSPKALIAAIDAGAYNDLFDGTQLARFRDGAQVEINRAAAAARAEAAAQKALRREQLATLRAQLEAGAGTPQDWEKYGEGVAAIGDTSQAVTARARAAEMRAAAQWKGASLQVMDERVSALTAKRDRTGLSTQEAAELKGITRERSEAVTRLNGQGGALSQYLYATGKTLERLNPDDAGAMQRRAQLAAAAASMYNRGTVEPITETELPMFRDMFAAGPAGKLRALETIRRFGDARAVAGAARQVAGSDDGDFRIAVMLPPQVARDVLLGPDKLKTQPGVLNAKEAARVLSTYYGSAVRQVGGGYDADVLKAATQFYASRMIDGGETTWDPGRFAEAIETVLGRTRSANGTIRGGVARTQQGLVIVPPDRTPETLMQTFARAGEPDYRAAAGGRAPRWGDGSAMTRGQLRTLLPTYRGNGRYGFRGRDGRLIPNDQGGVYEVDIYKLPAR
ncbi:hypothetical protein ASE65_10150 [Sphingomonas sp. Leaf16]|nr:hypothetical protein ASE65_10150 [Sphingomonas sp. Leaf16]KQN11456.1 hypothetical protein ASE81_11135 [Sphingomonas sp. Leaf29]KQN18778.1 hypothetical protein ASE83_11075 [Sphingomonas sp. Leaf32]